MKNLIFSALLLASIASFGQISLLPFYSISWTKSENESGLKRFHRGIALSYDLNKNVGISLEAKSSLWSLNGQIDRTVALRDNSLGFYVYQSIDKESKWFFRPSAGVLVGFGTPITANDQSQSNNRMKDDLQLLKHPYFFGVALEVGAGIKLSQRFLLSAFLKEEALVGMMTDRPSASQNASSTGILLGGLRCELVL